MSSTNTIPIPGILPVLSNAVGLLNLSFGTAGLLLVLCLDAWRSKTKKTYWIPGDSLLLGALSIQVLGLFYRPTTLISGSSMTDVYNKVDLDDMLLNLGGRVVTCVCFGIFLTDVARSRDRNLWSDILALSISATNLLNHLSYDIYMLICLDPNANANAIANPNTNSIFSEIYFKANAIANLRRGIVVWMLASNIIIFASIVLLVLHLVCAALSSKSIQEFVAQKIGVLLSRTEYRNPGSVVQWEAVEEHAVRSWITARTHQPQYIIARSVLGSSIGFVVTVCVAVSIVASIKNGYRAEDGLDTLRIMAIALQWIFILSGWAIICWRWLTAVVYFPRRMGSEGLSLRAYFRVEDFWKTTIVEMQKEFMELDEESIKRFSYLSRFLLIFLRKLSLYKLLYILLLLQISVVLLSKTCWLISEMVFSNLYMRKLLMGSACHAEFAAVYNLHNSLGVTGSGNLGDFLKYSDVLMHMPKENPAGVWIANRKLIQQLKARLIQGEYDGKNCKALISLLNKTAKQNLSSTDPFSVSLRRKLEDFSVGKSSSKMMVVSLLTIVIELSEFYQGSSGSFGGPPTDTVNECIQACCEAWKIMELGENSDPEAVLVNKQADRLFHNLTEWRRWLDVALPINNFEARTIEAVERALQGLADKGKQTANSGHYSKNCKSVIAGNSLYLLCESMKNHSVNVEELLDGIQSSLADVIRSCMFKVREIIVDKCTLWAQALMDEKLWDAIYEAGRAKGVTQRLLPDVKFGRQFEKIQSF